MAEPDERASGAPGEGVGERTEAGAARPKSKRKRDLAEQTGYVAGRTVTGAVRLALQNQTVRETLRNAKEARDSDD